MNKPHLILHPGFAKCATSSIQRLVVAKNFTLMTEINHSALGRGFRPNDGYPDVAELMYHEDNIFNQIMSNNYPTGRYFCSNEAIAGSKRAVEALAQRFFIRACVFSIRFPLIQSISNFRYSGWLEGTPEEYLLTSPNCANKTVTRMAAKVRSFRDTVSEQTKLCPIEPKSKQFEMRFFETCFGAIPSSLEKISGKFKKTAMRLLIFP